MDTLTKEAKRLIRKREVLERIHDLTHQKGNSSDQRRDPGTATASVNSESGRKVTLRRVGVR